MVSDLNFAEGGQGWQWVEEALKVPEGDVCKSKVTNETTSKLPTVLHIQWIPVIRKPL